MSTSTAATLLAEHPWSVSIEPRLAEEAADEMVSRWRKGERPLTEEYLERFPALREEAEAALELIAEELALRDEYDQQTSLSELTRRFPLWQPQLRVLLECHRALQPEPPPPLPAPGEVIGDFQLVSELGRGAHARVFLCRQASLGGRPVVLKVGPSIGHEHISLARLQHTHIVPLFSVHEFPDRGLRGLCMPYFGGVTLAAILEQLAELPLKPTGREVLGILTRAREVGQAVLPPPGPAWESLGRASFVDMVCWIGACLADALQYAHDRGLLHLDLKPSNVLIAADGMPMLLDFHLARPPLKAGDPPPVTLGGTNGYMPGEQMAALAAVRKCAKIPAELDGRADVFGLGMVLTETLRAADRDGQPAAIPTGVRDILARCTEADAADRYPTAADVAADLRRHLSDLPLKGVRNRSIRERWGKWRRRRPWALPVGLALAAVLALTLGVGLRFAHQNERTEEAVRDAETHVLEGRYAEAARVCSGAESVLDGLPYHRALKLRLSDIRHRAERGMAAEDLHQLCEQIRPLYVAESLSAGQVHAVQGQCDELWERRDRLAATLSGQANPTLEPRWRADLLDLGILTAHLGVLGAKAGEQKAAHRRALVILAEAETLLGRSEVLCLERARHARAVGDAELANRASAEAARMTPQTAWDHLVVGRAEFATGDLTRASAEMDRALRFEPGLFWANYYKGACRYKMGDPTEALASFTACVSLASRSAWCVYNRGLAYSELGRLEDARADFGRVLALDPSFGLAFIARATVHYRQGRHGDALADLQQAARAGVAASTVEYQQAVIYLAMNDRAAALKCLRACLAGEPAHPAALELLGRLNSAP